MRLLPSHRARVWPTIAVVVALLLAAAAPSTSHAEARQQATRGPSPAGPPDTLVVQPDGEAGDNTAVSLALRTVTERTVDTVLIARNDDFADALASGLLQASAPLYLVPPDGPLPPRVRQQIFDDDARTAILLGGEAALAPRLAVELQTMGLRVQRRAGANRMETAAVIAETDAPSAETVILARAFPDVDATDPSQAWADAVAVGGLAARTGWPILLTAGGQLSPEAAQRLARPSVTRVLVAGGTAAIAAAVEAEVRGLVEVVERMEGAGRAGTAVAVAGAAGDLDSRTVQRVVVVDGQGLDGWAAGVAAAAHAAVHDAPILLAPLGNVPPETAAFLAPGIRGEPGQPILTCVLPAEACDRVRAAIGEVQDGPLDLDPAAGPLEPGDTVRVLSADDRDAGSPVEVTGSCLGGAGGRTTQVGQVVTVDPDASGPCTLTARLVRDLGTVSATAVYGTSGAGLPPVTLDLDPGEVADLLVPATAGQQLSMVADRIDGGCVSLSLLGAGDADGLMPLVQGSEGDGSCSGGDRRLGPLAPGRVDADGVQRVRVVADDGGSLRVSLAPVLPEPVDLDAPVDPARPTATVAIDQAGQVAAFSFDAAAGDLMTLAISRARVDGCVRLLLHGPDGRPVDGITPTVGCEIIDHRVDAGGPIELPLDGAYSVTSTLTDDGTGEYDVDLLAVATVEVDIDGPDVEVVLDRPGQHVRHVFAGRAGQRVAFAVTGVVVTDCERVSLLGPDGGLLDQIAPTANCRVADHRLDSGAPATIPADGRHSVLVGVSRAATGRLALTLVRPAAGTIAVGDPPTEVVADRAGRSTVLQLAGRAGQELQITTSGVAAEDCERVLVYAPSGSLVGQVAPDCDPDTHDGVTAEALTLPVDGTYLLVAKVRAGGTGRFLLTLG